MTIARMSDSAQIDARKKLALKTTSGHDLTGFSAVLARQQHGAIVWALVSGPSFQYSNSADRFCRPDQMAIYDDPKPNFSTKLSCF